MKNKEQMTARYLFSFLPSIQDILGLHSLCTFSDAYNRALLVEKKQHHSASRRGQQFQSYSKADSSSNDGKGDNLDAKQSRINKFPVPSPKQPNGCWKLSQGGGFKCFKCGELGHQVAYYRKSIGGHNEHSF